MSLLVILSYYRLFHLELLLSIINYFTYIIFGNLEQFYYKAINYFFIGAINRY
jgi:hypothetical protein